MPYTTDDCKNFLVSLYPNTEKKSWKRTRKYKNTQGVVLRDFDYPNGLTQTLVETASGLMREEDYMNGVSVKQSNASAYEQFIDRIGLSSHLFGGAMTSNTHLTDNLAKFLNVLEHGIDWQAPEGKRSAFDFSSQLDFKEVVKTHPDILQQTVTYTNYAISFICELDETYMPHHCSRIGFDDSVPDLINLLEKIKSAYQENKLPLIVNKRDVKETLAVMQDIQDIMCEEPEMIEQAEKSLDKMRALLLSFHAK